MTCDANIKPIEPKIRAGTTIDRFNLHDYRNNFCSCANDFEEFLIELSHSGLLRPTP